MPGRYLGERHLAIYTLSACTKAYINGITHRLGSKTPAFLRVSAKTGTVELTGLEMTKMKALGHDLAIAEARVAQIPALMFYAE
jgi:hypothetical protein